MLEQYLLITKINGIFVNNYQQVDQYMGLTDNTVPNIGKLNKISHRASSVFHSN